MAKTAKAHWALLLHFYQPFGQKRSIIDAITEQCYRPIAQELLANPDARVTINFSGVLLDQLAKYGHKDVINMYREAVELGRVELVGSAKFHAILPLLPEAEARRQIEINNQANRNYFREAYQPKGFFLPEMAWSPALAPVLEKAGFEWVLLDELAYNGKIGQVDYTKSYRVEGTNLKAIFREHDLSASIMSAAPRNAEDLKEAAREALAENRAIVTGMDGETFGHHRVGHEQLLFEMFRDPDIPMVLMSELLKIFPETVTIATVASTWASSEDDIARGIPFISWSDPTNKIHRLQWKLLNLTAEEMHQLAHTDPDYERLRSQLDPAMASDPFFWAAARPWWMIEHIERGAYELLDVLQHLPTVSPELAARGLNIYQEIMALAWDWQRSGKIDTKLRKRAALVRIPFREETESDIARRQAILDLLQREEVAAADRGDYEAAILWRDGRYKLRHKLDIYDVMYVLDILKKKLPAGEIERTVLSYRAKYDHIRGGQVEQRSN